MKEEYGKIVELAGDLATVRVGRHETCTACGACGGARQVVVKAVNKAGAKVGDEVRFEFLEEKMLLGAFMVFVWPLIFAAVGAAFGFLLAPSLDADIDSSAIGGAIVFFLLSLFLVKKFDKKAAANSAAKPVIVEILGK